MKTNHVWKIVLLLTLIYMSSFGQLMGNLIQQDADYATVGRYSAIAALVEIGILTLIMIFVPSISCIVNKGKLSYDFGKKLCLWNSIICFCISEIILIFTERLLVGGVGAFFFYFINKWLFVNQNQPIKMQSSFDHSYDMSSNINTPTDSDPIDTIDNQTIPLTNNKSKPARYCSRCGYMIDAVTKKCTGCGKQYFKGLSIKTIISITLTLLLTVSVTGNIFLFIKYQEMNIIITQLNEVNQNYEYAIENLNEINSELSIKNISLQSQNTELKSQTTKLENSQQDYIKVIEFFDTYIVFIEDDGTNLYHKYNCSKFVGNYFWAYNLEAAKNNGYKPCQQCHSQP